MPGQQYLTYRSPKEGLSPYETAKQDRRIHLAIKQGMPLGRIMRSYAVPESRVKEVAALYGLEIVKSPRGRKKA